MPIRSTRSSTTLRAAADRVTDDELSHLGVVLVIRRVDATRRRVVAAHYVRPVARDVHGHLQRLGPAVLATWDPTTDAIRALRLGRDAGARASGSAVARATTRSRPTVGGSYLEDLVASRHDRAATPFARAIEAYRPRPFDAPRARRVGSPSEPRPARGAHRGPDDTSRSPAGDARRPASLRLAVADRQGGAPREPPRPSARRAASSSRASSATRIRSSRPSRTRSSPATTSSSSASAARPRRGWRGCSSASSTRGCPVVRGGELNDDPFAPISPAGRAIVERDGDAPPIDWLPRDRRYAEKLATPDITIADLIGEVDPIKVAEGRYLSDELTLHYGLIPRANRGIVAINELPDLAERIQVGLLNILEERDVQIRGFVVRLPLDLYVVASANPEDYTSRGRIITPLKDRLGSQIRTHYPRTLEHEMAIVRQEKHRFEAEERHADRRRPARSWRSSSPS